MLDWLLIIFILGGLIFLALGYGSFMSGFREKFGRSFVHWLEITVIIVVILSFAMKDGSTAWAVIHYIAWAALAALGIWHLVKYGFL